jgi:hypothetical protein
MLMQGSGHGGKGYTQPPPVGQKPAAHEFLKDAKLPRPILILLIVLVVIVGAMLALAALDRPVPVTHVEQPVTANAATH